MLLYGQLPSGSSLWWAGSFWYLTKKKKKAPIKYVPDTWALLGWKQRGGGREQGLMLERKGCVCVCVCATTAAQSSVPASQRSNVHYHIMFCSVSAYLHISGLIHCN